VKAIGAAVWPTTTRGGRRFCSRPAGATETYCSRMSLFRDNVAIKHRYLADELNGKHRGHCGQPERAPPPAGDEAGASEETLRGWDARERVRRRQEARLRIAARDRVFGEERQAGARWHHGEGCLAAADCDSDAESD